MPSHITYRRVIYLKHLKKSLLRLGGAQHAGSINRQLRELLHYINFNSPEYVAYCVQYIERHLNSPDMSDHMGTLILDRYRKLIIQQPVKPSFSLDPVAPSLSHMLCEWIDAETWFVERSLQADDTSPAVPEGLISRFRIIVDLTSEQLSYFFRLLILAETIKNDNKTILSSIVSKVFLTNTEKGKKRHRSPENVQSQHRREAGR